MLKYSNDSLHATSVVRPAVVSGLCPWIAVPHFLVFVNEIVAGKSSSACLKGEIERKLSCIFGQFNLLKELTLQGKK